MSVQVAALWPLPAAFPGVLSAVRGVRQQDRVLVGGRGGGGMTSGPGHVGRVSRQRRGQTGMWQ